MTDLDGLERLFDAALAAALPNPVALIFSDLPLAYQGKRDLVFALGMLDEGENECALIAGFIRDRLAAQPGADVSHLEREAWYYLRTSIDPTWQFDDGAASLPAALAYLARVLAERTATAAARSKTTLAGASDPTQRAALLRHLRSLAGKSSPSV
jgi:hypothetical protein